VQDGPAGVVSHFAYSIPSPGEPVTAAFLIIYDGLGAIVDC
jgi:hypothetical protein